MPEKFKNKYRIPSARLPYWDYGWNGAYFMTICTQHRICYFGAVENGEMILSEIGRMAHIYWQKIPEHFPFVILDEFVIMPNHVHGIIIINKSDENDNGGNGDNVVETRHALSLQQNTENHTATPAQNRFRNPGKNNISSIIGSYKSVVSKHAHKINKMFAWQSRFYDHIIRNEKEFYRIQQYILYNPAKWADDQNNQDGVWI